jgi:hypothetical protein
MYLKDYLTVELYTTHSATVHSSPFLSMILSQTPYSLTYDTRIELPLYHSFVLLLNVK